MIVGILCFAGGMFIGAMIASCCAVASKYDDDMDKSQK